MSKHIGFGANYNYLYAALCGVGAVMCLSVGYVIPAIFFGLAAAYFVRRYSTWW